MAKARMEEADQITLPMDLEEDRPVPKMPEGYYSGDQPNPNLAAFVERHRLERPYDPETDDYDVPAFDHPIGSEEASKTDAIYRMHRYDSKKPHDAIRQYIRHYTEPGDLVLDPFCGSGGTALAALMEGRKAIAIDRSPAATFITKNYCTPVNVKELKAAFEELKRKVKPEIDWLYETRCERCGGKATTGYTVYSQVFQCPRCGEKVALIDCADADTKTLKGAAKTIKVCPRCKDKGFIEAIKTTSQKFGAIPVMVSYLCEAGCKPARGERRHNDLDERKREYFRECDLAKIKAIEGRQIPYWYPRDRMMNAPEEQERWGVKWRAGSSNFRSVDELFTRRNLWALGAWRSGGDPAGSVQESIFCFAVTAMAKGTSKMCQFDPKWSFPYPIMSGTYYTPPLFKEPNVGKAVSDKIDAIARGIYLAGLTSPAWISTQSATDLPAIPAVSVDYIFTDPPYADKVQYGELNFIWEAWLGLDTHWHDEEIIVNEVRGKTEADWADAMRRAMAECYRVLKPGRWISLCYHDTSEGTWTLLQDLMAEAGFLADQSTTALFIDTRQKSYNQINADKVNKRDLVINFRKPKPGEAAAEIQFSDADDETTIHDKVRTIITDYLTLHPGATKDRVFDEVVSRLVRAGKMQPHNFDELLASVAEPADSEGLRTAERWYLSGVAAATVDRGESQRESAAAKTLRSFMEQRAREAPEMDGVHYSDLFEQYVYRVKEKTRRPLTEWLPDYFIRTDSGAYRLPDETEEARLTAARANGVSRKIKHYAAFLEGGLAIPAAERPDMATLAAWIRHCKNAGLYQLGRLLYERGGFDETKLSEEAAANAEEDYSVCVRHLTKAAAKARV